MDARAHILTVVMALMKRYNDSSGDKPGLLVAHMRKFEVDLEMFPPSRLKSPPAVDQV